MVGWVEGGGRRRAGVWVEAGVWVGGLVKALRRGGRVLLVAGHH